MVDLSKLRKKLEKRDIPTGFSPIPDWICSGNMGLNYIISGDLEYGYPVGRTTFVSGPQGSGKSFLLANAMKAAQMKGYTIVLLDTENSLDESFMEKVGVCLDDDVFLPIRVFSIEQATSVVSELLQTTEKEEKIGLFIDSLSNLESSQEIDKFQAGELASTQGLVQKKYKQFIKGINNRIGDRNMFCIMSTHVYLNQEQYQSKYKVSGGESIQFLPSVGVWIDKSPLKDGKEFVGITVRLKTYKTRYQQLGMSTDFALPYTEGMDLYDGCVPILVSEGIIEQAGAWYSYLDSDGNVAKFQKSKIDEHIDELVKRYREKRGEVVEKDDADSIE